MPQSHAVALMVQAVSIEIPQVVHRDTRHSTEEFDMRILRVFELFEHGLGGYRRALFLRDFVLGEDAGPGAVAVDLDHVDVSDSRERDDSRAGLGTNGSVSTISMVGSTSSVWGPTAAADGPSVIMLLASSKEMPAEDDAPTSEGAVFGRNPRVTLKDMTGIVYV